MTVVKCGLCFEMICKYSMDFRSSGGIIFGLKDINICLDCRKKIAKDLIEEA